MAGSVLGLGTQRWITPNKSWSLQLSLSGWETDIFTHNYNEVRTVNTDKCPGSAGGRERGILGGPTLLLCPYEEGVDGVQASSSFLWHSSQNSVPWARWAWPWKDLGGGVGENELASFPHMKKAWNVIFQGERRLKDKGYSWECLETIPRSSSASQALSQWRTKEWGLKTPHLQKPTQRVLPRLSQSHPPALGHVCEWSSCTTERSPSDCHLQRTNQKARESVEKTEKVIKVPTYVCLSLKERKTCILRHVQGLAISYLLKFQIVLIVGRERGETRSPQCHLQTCSLLSLCPSSLTNSHQEETEKAVVSHVVLN